jgi:hypothetical protein
MPRQEDPKSQPPAAPESAAQHVADAHHLLKSLREKVGSHPELDEAIRKLEHVLDNLTLNSGGLL